MNLKIVEVDYGDPLPTRAQSCSSTVDERHDCPDCYRWFNNAASLRVHRMWHGVRRRRQLGPPVGQVRHNQDSEEDISDFESEMDSRGVYSCKLCGKIYLYLHAYKKHLQIHRYNSNSKKTRIMPSQYLPGSKKYECPECGCSFLRRAKLIRHLKLHRMRNSNRKCDPCNKIFASDTSWIGHIQLHEQRPFWCYTCAKGFTDQQIFNKHMFLHKCRKFTCTVCNKTFMFRRQLNDHLNLHTGAKPHICTFCGMGFSHSSYLYAHKKSQCKRTGFKSGWVRKSKIRRINTIERQRVERTLKMLSGENEKNVSQNIVDTDAPALKRWEWECCECDVGFDEVTQLHGHYIQHATGDIPMG
uniref:C2H2-type domain-containing protein n=1 Tax=Neogobius melanostomus TaxID=47308 RepID=A0A8C6SKM3_9GOBI